MDLEISGGTVKVDDETIREIVSELVNEALTSRTVEDAIRDEVRSEVSDQISEVDFTDYMDGREIAREVVGRISAADIEDIGEVVEKQVIERIDEALEESSLYKDLLKRCDDLAMANEAQAQTIGELTAELIRLKDDLRSV